MAACGPKGESGGMSGAREPAPVSVAAVTRDDVPVRIVAVGNVEAYSTVSVKAQVSGELTEVHFNEGGVVHRDDVLFSIDARPFDVALREAEANRARAEAQREQAVASRTRDAAQAENARKEFERDEPLLAQRMVSQEEFDAAKAEADAARAAVAADEAAIKAAEQATASARAAIDNAKLELDYCTIRSPLDGRTGSLLVHKGNLVKANDTTPLVVIAQTRPIYVSFAAPEKRLSEIRDEMAKGPLTVTAVIPGREAEPETGALTFVDNTVDDRTGTIRLKAAFDNKEERLWPGQFVTATLLLSVIEGATTAPSAAIQAGQSGKHAYVVKSDMTVDVRPIEIGEDWNDRTLVTKGLEPGENVVVDGMLKATPGAKVRVVSDDAKDGAAETNAEKGDS